MFVQEEPLLYDKSNFKMIDKAQVQHDSPGRDQFLSSRAEMLDAYDRARTKARVHKVQVHHGKVAEAQFRAWLERFLPKKFGVTSGFIVSPLVKRDEAFPHFDVIIYDRLNSPVLWIDDSLDNSSQGNSLAIPAEYVHCVLEVKSKLSSTTSKEAIDHLEELIPFMSGINEQGGFVKPYFPIPFGCGVVFFELMRKKQFSETALNNLLAGDSLRGFFGGIVLRGEGKPGEESGIMSLGLFNSPEDYSALTDKSRSLLDFGLSESAKKADNKHLALILQWQDINFAKFAFDIVAILSGRYKSGMLSSLYGVGNR